MEKISPKIPGSFTKFPENKHEFIKKWKNTIRSAKNQKKCKKLQIFSKKIKFTVDTFFHRWYIHYHIDGNIAE